MKHDFDFKGAAEMPYNPRDYNLPIWRDEDHLPPQETVTEEKAPQAAESLTAEAAKNKLRLWAEEQLGYHEGDGNSNKYADTPGLAEMYGWNPQNQPWCDVFVDSGFISCFGLENACKMTYQPMGAGSALCRQSAQYYKDNGAFFQTPEIGDQVFFYSAGDINHTGVVVRVVGGSIVTVEGNSSDSVAERCYSVSDSKIAGYGRPNWTAVNLEGIKDYGVGVEPGEPGIVEEQRAKRSILKKGMIGEDVRELQEKLVKLGYDTGGVEGKYGTKTFIAVAKLQEEHQLTPVDGEAGPVTMTLIDSLLDEQPAVHEPAPDLRDTLAALAEYLQTDEFLQGFNNYIERSKEK